MRRIIRFAPFSRSLTTHTRNWTEVKIPVPWGHVAGKWWGPGKSRPIVSLHGWQDNSGTFDTLIPLLPENVEFLAIDLPGHGYSSPLPAGVPYIHMDYVVLLRRLQRYFGWTQMSLMGHSLGGITVFTYSATYPSDVDMLICLDGFRPLIIKNIAHKRAARIDDFLKYDALRNLDSKSRPSRPMEVLEQMWHEATRKSIYVDKCHYVLKRNVAPSPEDPNKFYLTIDPRLKMGNIMNFPQEEILEAAKLLKMPTLLVKASQLIYQHEHINHINEVSDVMSEVNPKVEKHTVEGTHHVHLNHPERLQKILCDFLSKYYHEEKNSFEMRQANL